MKCPICDSEEAETATECPHCKWKFRYFLSMTPEEKDLYRAMMDKARKEWKAKQHDDLPPFKRGMFEFREEFKARIESKNPCQAGIAKLLSYDVDKSAFDIEIRWTDSIPVKFPSGSFFICAERDFAKNLYRENKEYPVFAHLTVREDEIVLTGADLFGLNEYVPIKGSAFQPEITTDKSESIGNNDHEFRFETEDDAISGDTYVNLRRSEYRRMMNACLRIDNVSDEKISSDFTDF